MTPSRPRISVVLATRNGVPFIAEQIESILEQSMPPDEIVVSDDASEDATTQVITTAVESRRGTGTPIDLVVIRHPRALGIRRNFESGLRAATGDLIALCDQDDRWHADRIERAVAVFSTRPRLQLVHSDARLIDADGASLGQSLFGTLPLSARERAAIHRGDALSVLLRRNVVTGATTMVRRRLVEAALPIPKGWLHDEWLAIWSAATAEIELVDDALIDYRQHTANAVGVAARSLSVITNRLREPGDERNRRLLLRAQSLLQRATSGKLSSVFVAIAEAKHEHELARSALPVNRAARVAPIVRELSTGRYSRFGHGPADALRDLIQPRHGG